MKHNIIGQIIEFNGKNYTVIGVVKDMVMESPYKPVRPMIFFYNSSWTSQIIRRYKAGCAYKGCII